MGFKLLTSRFGLSWCWGGEMAPVPLPVLLGVVVGLLWVQTRFILRPHVNEVLCQANVTVFNFSGTTAGWPCLTPGLDRLRWT